MKLERLALWDEKYLFTEQGEPDKGYIGWLKGCFNEDRLVLSDMVMTGDNDYMIRYELESLCIFLANEGAGYMLRTLSDLNCFCRDKVHDHVPYSFNRECWGFRVLTEDYVWYIALTPWNPVRHVTIHCYDRKILMTALAQVKGLPEYCYGVLRYTGERILIRYGEDLYDSFPQYGGNMVVQQFCTPNTKVLDYQGLFVFLGVKTILFHHCTFFALYGLEPKISTAG